MATNPYDKDAVLTRSDFAIAGELSSNSGHAIIAAETNRLFDTAPSDSFWASGPISFDRWNKKFPYQLLILKKSGEGYDVVAGGKFTLPIPPQSMSISTPFAINVTATQGGIIEEHNGAPFRNISFSGTTGVAPLRGEGSPVATAGLGATIFAGTIKAASALSATASNIVDPRAHGITNTFDPLKDANVLVSGGSNRYTTGYAQFRLLQNFIERYLHMKKQDKGRDLRLAFAIWKDEAVYLVTPLVFDLQRSAQSPLEYTYSFQLKAWRRVSLEKASYNTKMRVKPISRDPNAMADALTRMAAAQDTILRSADLMGAAGRDIIEVTRKAVLFAKDTVGASFTLIDMPASIAQAARSAILEGASVVGQARSSAKNTQRLYEEAGKNWSSLGTDALIAAAEDMGNKTNGVLRARASRLRPDRGSVPQPRRAP
jgi:hypothetical protein